MKLKKNKIKWCWNIFVLFLITLFSGSGHFYKSGLPYINPERLECFMVLAGKNATVDGSVLLAHNNDLSGKEASLLEKYPRKNYRSGEMVTFPSGLKIPRVRETYEWMVLRIYNGFAEGDAVAINEFQVAIAGGLALGDDRNKKAVAADPLIKEGLTGGVRYIALQRSRTARECVELIGKLYTKYGVTYPSGVGIADPEEVWYIESGGGRSWAAVRIPDDKVWVQANGYRIGEIDTEDKKNFLSSPELKKFAAEKGLWDPSMKKFNFSKTFGRKKRNRKNRYYNSRRIWRGMDLLAPSLKLNPEAEEFPMFLTPDKKVDLKKLFSILRDTYSGTPYDIYSGKGSEIRERSISVPGSVHTDVIQLRRGYPADIGAVLWAGVGPTPFTIYVPFYFGINKVPDLFGVAGEEYHSGSAFWLFRSLCDLAEPDFKNVGLKIISDWERFEKYEIKLQSDIDNKALELFRNDKDKSGEYLTGVISGLGFRSLNMVREFLTRLKRVKRNP